MNNKFKYRESGYFDENSTYVFKNTDGFEFESGVHYERGYWWTNENLKYKCTTIKCYKK